MAQPLPFQTCYPQAKFAFPRSYIWGISIQWDTTNAIWSGASVDVYDAPGTYHYFHLDFDTRFWNWNSNRWTLDYVLTDAWYTTPPSPTHLPLHVNLEIVHWPANAYRPTINVSPFGLGVNFTYHAAPPAPPGYWSPPWM